MTTSGATQVSGSARRRRSSYAGLKSAGQHTTGNPRRLLCHGSYGSVRVPNARRLLAILTFRRRMDRLTGAAKVIDGDTIVVAGQLVRLHGIDAPELDQTFWWRGQHIA